jgi:hypothetical protein
MKIREILREGDLDGTPAPDRTANLIPVLLQLQQRFNDREVSNPVMRVDAVLRNIQNLGSNVTIQDLMDAWDSDPAIKNIVKNITPTQIQFKTKFDIDSGDEGDEEAQPGDSEQVVSQMAQNAM